MSNRIEGGSVTLGRVASGGSLDINDMVNTVDSVVLTVGDDMAGEMILRSGIAADQSLAIGGELTTTGTINFNGGDMAGALLIAKGGAGRILNGGSVESGQQALLCCTVGYTFSGQAEFVTVATLGALSVEAGGIDGEITIHGDLLGSIATRLSGFFGKNAVSVRRSTS